LSGNYLTTRVQKFESVVRTTLSQKGVKLRVCIEIDIVEAKI
jgi:hypothetical protein